MAREVAVLRQQGLTHKQVGQRLGISESYAQDLARDPEGLLVFARKQSYRGTCERCGRRTTGSNGPKKAPKICNLCSYKHQRENRKWTREVILERIQAWAAIYGRPPVATQWLYATRGRNFPPASAVYGPDWQIFRSWADAIEAAGFPRPRKSHYQDESRRGLKSKIWTKEAIIKWIQDNATGYEPPIMPRGPNSSIVSAACREFGSWREAVEVAGFIPRKPGGKVRRIVLQ